MTAEVRVEPPDPAWLQLFEELRDRASAALGDLVVRIEHVGSTSVPGLAAKAVIDLDVVIPSRADLPEAVERLAAVGYTHLGDLGIKGREAFNRPYSTPRHNLYVCAADSEELARHVRFRDYLRSHPEAAREYAGLKRELAERYRWDVDAYCEAKTGFVEGVLGRIPES